MKAAGSYQMGSVQQKLLLLTLAIAVMASTLAFARLNDWDPLTRSPESAWLYDRNPLTRSPESEKCWKHIKRVDGCQHELFAAFGQDKLDQIFLSFKCCQAIQRLPRRCGIWIFGGRAFVPSFATNVHEYCALIGVNTPRQSMVHHHNVHHHHVDDEYPS